MGKSMCCKGEAVKSDNVTHRGHIQALTDEDAPYSLTHQHLVGGLGAKGPTRNSHENPFLDRAAVLCPVLLKIPAYTQLCLQ